MKQEKTCFKSNVNLLTCRRRNEFGRRGSSFLILPANSEGWHRICKLKFRIILFKPVNVDDLVSISHSSAVMASDVAQSRELILRPVISSVARRRLVSRPSVAWYWARECRARPAPLVGRASCLVALEPPMEERRREGSSSQRRATSSRAGGDHANHLPLSSEWVSSPACRHSRGSSRVCRLFSRLSVGSWSLTREWSLGRSRSLVVARRPLPLSSCSRRRDRSRTRRCTRTSRRPRRRHSRSRRTTRSPADRPAAPPTHHPPM